MFRILTHLFFRALQFGFLALQVFGAVVHRDLQPPLLFHQVMDAPLPHQHHNNADEQDQSQAQGPALPPAWSDAKRDLTHGRYGAAHAVHRLSLKAIRARIEARIANNLVSRLHPLRFQAQQAIADADLARIAKTDRFH